MRVRRASRFGGFDQVRLTRRSPHLASCPNNTSNELLETLDWERPTRHLQRKLLIIRAIISPCARVALQIRFIWPRIRGLADRDSAIGSRRRSSPRRRRSLLSARRWSEKVRQENAQRLHASSFLFAAALVAMLGLLAPSIAGGPNWPNQMTLGTASPGGTYYVYGEGVANILTRALDMPVVRQATEGPLQNIELMEAGQIQFGFVTMGVALQAWNASGVWTPRVRARHARDFSDVRHAVPVPCSATVGNTIDRRHRRQTPRGRPSWRHIGDLCTAVLQRPERAHAGDKFAT
jgi:hypothetical protein